MSRASRAIIDLAALKRNCALAAQLCPTANILAVIKANAYGHGAVQVALTLEPSVQAFGVARIEEALTLRGCGVGRPILLLEGAFDADEVMIAAGQDFWLMVENASQVQAITEAPLQSIHASRGLRVWLKVDTGMHRLGFQPQDVYGAYEQLKQSRNVQGDIVICTHFACAELLNQDTTEVQFGKFNSLIRPLNVPSSLANSAAVLAWPQTHGDWIRPGLMLYGASPFEAPHDLATQLHPVMTLQSAVISTRRIATGERVGYGGAWCAERTSNIATVAIGYGDGYPRGAKNGTPVVVNGQVAPLAGRVSMDMITVDVTDLEGITVGNRAELWGNTVSVSEVARYAGTNAYELLARMPQRVVRRYVH